MESATIPLMKKPVSTHSHRHRSHRPDRTAQLLQTAFLVVGGLAGLVCLVLICLVLPGGLTFLLIVGGLLALGTLALLSCMTGHLTATIVNFCRLQYGRADLELTLKRTRHGRHG